MNDDKQTATLPAVNTSNARNYGIDKETTNAWVGIGIGRSRSDVDHVVTVRTYSGRSRNASRVYASVWVYANGRGFSGTAYASGGGYHKASAAVAGAIASAGIDLAQPINGRGDQAIEDAVRAIVAACGYNTVRVIRGV